jgi:peptide/nickel transport system substrate-binding protein
VEVRRSVRKRWSAVGALVMALSLVAAACGGGDGGNGGGSGTGGDDAGTPRAGGAVTYGLEADNTGGWCLAEAQLAIAGIQVARSIYDTLTAPDADGVAQPYLAQDVTPNADFTQWTITIRPDITFHDGTPLTAEVVKNNIDAWRGQYEARSPLLFVFVFENVADVQVTAPDAVTVTTKTPWTTFPAYLFLSGRAGIMAQAQLDSPNCTTELIGTGPFKKGEWRQGESYQVVKNENYWQTDSSGQKLPYLDSITFFPFPDGDARLNALLSGRLNALHTSGAEQIDTLNQEEEDGKVAITTSDEFAEVTYAMFNASKPPFDNINARLAVAYGFDRDLFNQVRNLDLFTMASGPFAQGNIGYVEDAGFPEFDLDEAKRYAALYEQETGQPLSFSLVSTPDPSTVKSAQFAQEQARAAGIEVRLRTLEQSQLISTAIGGDFEAMTFRNFPGGDPDTNYVWWKGGSPVNFNRFNDAEIDQLLEQGRAATDADERQEIYADINRRFSSQVYNLWLNWTQWAIGTAPNVRGVYGPGLPDASGQATGADPFPGLATGHPVLGMWINAGS